MALALAENSNKLHKPFDLAVISLEIVTQIKHESFREVTDLDSPLSQRHPISVSMNSTTNKYLSVFQYALVYARLTSESRNLE